MTIRLQDGLPYVTVTLQYRGQQLQAKHVDQLSLGALHVRDFAIEVGAMAYGFTIDGIVGIDFLLHVGVVIDLSRLEVRETSSELMPGGPRLASRGWQYRQHTRPVPICAAALGQP